MADSKPTPSPIPTPLPRSLKTSIMPNGNTSKQETIRLAIRLGSVVLLTASVLIYACLRSKDLSVAEILAIVGGGAALAGLATAARVSGGGGGGSTGTTILGGALLLLATVIGSGCGAGPLVQDQRPDDGVEPCEVESAIVDGLAVALDDVEEVLPADTPKAEDGIGYARGVVEEGRASVAACRALTEEHGSGLTAVIPWLTAAASVVRGIIAILTAAHVDLPDALLGILRSLGLAQATLPQIEREAPWDVAVAR
jgi:hypothetical protein